MTFPHETFWSLGVVSRSFEERQVLDILGSSLKHVYGEPEREPLPDEIRHLVQRLADVENERVRASTR
jgi:hypothetical protein